MTKRLIEMVCTGNNGRSPVAELLANNYLTQIGADREYEAISSGTMVGSLKAGTVALSSMQEVTGFGKRIGLYKPEELEAIDAAIKLGDAETIRPYFDRTATYLANLERAMRDSITTRFGVQGTLKVTRDQTIVRTDVVIVMPMDKRNVAKVKAIYEGSPYTPAIDLLGNVAIGNPDAEIRNAFGQTEDAHLQMVEQLIDYVPKAVAKIIKA